MEITFFITADRSHLRIYREDPQPGQSSPHLHVVDSVDFPAGRRDYTDRESDQAGRFPGFQGTGGGMSIDERLPMEREHDRQLVALITRHIEDFLANWPSATWRWAAGAEINHSVVSGLSPGVTARLERSVQKDLANVPVQQIPALFSD